MRQATRDLVTQGVLHLRHEIFIHYMTCYKFHYNMVYQRVCISQKALRIQYAKFSVIGRLSRNSTSFYGYPSSSHVHVSFSVL